MEENKEATNFAESLKAAFSAEMGKSEKAAEVKEEAKADVVADDKADDTASKEPQEENAEVLHLIPKDWTEAEKKEFQDALDNPALAGAAKAFIKRYESLRDGFHKKAVERAELAKTQSMWDAIFDSNAKDSLKQKGMSEQDYVKSLLNVEKSLIMKPAETIKKLMEICKVDPKTLSGDDEEYVTDIDKTIKEMRAELASLKNEKTQTKEQTAAQEQAFIAKQIRDFEFAIDESGESKYPLFKQVRDEMGIFISNGKAKTLEEAYEMSPTVKESRLEAKKNLQSREDIEAEKQAVAKAKKAAKGVTNKQIVTQDSRKMSFEERFAEKLRKAKAG